MADESHIEDIMTGLELGLMSQEQVVSDFRQLVSKDLAAAALQYESYAQKLEVAAFGGNAQYRSMAGGPDSLSRARLIDIMVGNYASASKDVKERIVELAVKPLLRDNSFYVTLAVARMTNPYVVADIIRKYPLFNPGPDFYEQDLLQGNNLTSAGSIQEWLNKFVGENFFAASAVALQTSQAADVEAVIDANLELFQGAAHVVASHHDVFANRKMAKNPEANKEEILEKSRSYYVDTFADMVRQSASEANWLDAAN